MRIDIPGVGERTREAIIGDGENPNRCGDLMQSAMDMTCYCATTPGILKGDAYLLDMTASDSPDNRIYVSPGHTINCRGAKSGGPYSCSGF